MHVRIKPAGSDYPPIAASAPQQQGDQGKQALGKKEKGLKRWIFGCFSDQSSSPPPGTEAGRSGQCVPGPTPEQRPAAITRPAPRRRSPIRQLALPLSHTIQPDDLYRVKTAVTTIYPDNLYHDPLGRPRVMTGPRVSYAPAQQNLPAGHAQQQSPPLAAHRWPHQWRPTNGGPRGMQVSQHKLTPAGALPGMKVQMTHTHPLLTEPALQRTPQLASQQQQQQQQPHQQLTRRKRALHEGRPDMTRSGNGLNGFTRQSQLNQQARFAQQPQPPSIEERLKADFDDMGPDILRSQRHGIVPVADGEAPAFRTLHSLDGSLETHHSITTPSSTQQHGPDNKIMSSMLTLSNSSHMGSQGNSWSPIPQSLLNTNEQVIDRDTKVLSKDWICDISSSAPEWHERMENWSHAWGAPSTTLSTAHDLRGIDRGQAASGSQGLKQNEPTEPRTPAPIGSSRQHPHSTSSLGSHTRLGGIKGSSLALDPNVAAAAAATGRSSWPPPAQVPCSLMATMPHEGILQHMLAREAPSEMGMATAVAIRNGRAAPAEPAGPRKLARRPLRVARPRAAARRAAGPRPSETLQCFDYSKLQTALEVLVAPGASRQPSPFSIRSPSGSMKLTDGGDGSSSGSGSGSAQAGSRAGLDTGEIVDDGTCEERVKLLGPGLHGAAGWGPAAGALARWARQSGRSEAFEMHQEEIQALYWKQKSLVDEAAEAAADLEAGQAEHDSENQGD